MLRSQISIRRDFLKSAAASVALSGTSIPIAGAQSRPMRVAAVYTVLRFRSHAYNILENFIKPYLFRGEYVEPGVELVSLYADQFPKDDMTREVSKKWNIPLYDTIERALHVGTKEIAVDAVLLIGEHGDYPHNELGQQMYPRKRFFDEIMAVMKRSNRFLPIFNDKHLSYRWDWAKEMYDTAKQFGVPLMAGSSVPLAERRPMLELPMGVELEEAVSIHGGGLESYDFHGLEILQAMVEARKGGETGVREIELLADEKMEEAKKRDDWPHALIDAAMKAEEMHDEKRKARPRVGVFQSNSGTSGQGASPTQVELNRKFTKNHAIRITYRDGFRATMIKGASSSDRWNFACRVKGESSPQSCMFFNGPWGNRNLFKALSHAIQSFFRTGVAPYPIERTLLTNGMVDAAVRSHHEGGRKLETPHLAITYSPKDYRLFRENGASWKILTRDTVEPTDFSPGDR